MTVQEYNDSQPNEQREICEKLQESISQHLDFTENKLWHGHPVWFIDGNPIVGYSVEKKGVRLMFWSGRDFEESELVGDSRFKDASIYYNSPDDIHEGDVQRWLKKSETIQWDYKNIVKNKGNLERLQT